MNKPLALTKETLIEAVSMGGAALDADATDERLLEMWLHGKSGHTKRAYRRDVKCLRAFTGGKPLRAMTLGDLQAFADSLEGEASSRGRVLAGVKSLLTFASKLGALPFNVGAALRKPPARDGLADRILDEGQVQRMLGKTEGRDHALVRLLYAGGFRISELVGLRWKDLADASDGEMYVTVLGKGGKTRTVRISAATATILHDMRGDAREEDPLFKGYKGQTLSASQAARIVKAVAKKAQIPKSVSPHFMRHAHASHAIERGVKVTTVRDTLGHSSIAVTDRYAHARPEKSSGLALPV
jgi:site-specific recombinase XerD